MSQQQGLAFSIVNKGIIHSNPRIVPHPLIPLPQRGEGSGREGEGILEFFLVY
jgi:hypothetical protein